MSIKILCHLPHNWRLKVAMSLDVVQNLLLRQGTEIFADQDLKLLNKRVFLTSHQHSEKEAFLLLRGLGRQPILLCSDFLREILNTSLRLA